MQAQTMAEKPQRLQSMNLFSQWEVEGTSSSCVPRVCTLRIVRLEVNRTLGQDLTELVINVSIRGSRRNLRSDCVPLPQTGPIDVELDFAFSLQYPHFIKRRGNLLQVMLQRKKKYKGRPMLGYKTLAIGQIDMAQVLQGFAPNNLSLYTKGEKSPIATITLATLSSQSIDQDVPGRRVSGQENLSSTDEEADDDLSGSEAEFSAGEIEESRPLADFDPQAIIPTKTSRTLKKKFMDAIFRKLKANPEDYSDIQEALYAETNEPDVDENQIEFLYDEDDDSEAEELFDDSLSIGSSQRPKLRPFFDQLSRNESTSTLTHELSEKQEMRTAPRPIKEFESGDDSKELSPSSDSDQQREGQPKEKIDLVVTQPTRPGTNEGGSPFRNSSYRSKSFRERRDAPSLGDHQHLKRKSSVDFDSVTQAAVQPLSDQMLAALSAEDNIPEKIFLISTRESNGQILAMKLMNRIERLICTASNSDVQSVMATIASKLQKYCNKHSISPAPMKICIIGQESYLSTVLRSYVDHFSLRSLEFQSYVRFLVVPLGNNRLATYLGTQDAKYNSLFMDQTWRSTFEQALKREEDFVEIERRIWLYANSASLLMAVPIAEALITYKAGKSSEGESSQHFIPFVTEVRVTGPVNDLETEECIGATSVPRDIPTSSASTSNSTTTNLSASPNSRDSSLEKNMQSPSTPWGSPMQHENLDLQIDYWPVISTCQTGKREEKKEPNKLSIKATFRSLVVTRLPNSECDEPNALYLSAQTKARNKGVMRLKKTRDKDTEQKSIVTSFVSKIVCTSKSHSQTFNVMVDGTEWCGIKFFALSSQWPTHVKHFPIGVFNGV